MATACPPRRVVPLGAAVALHRPPLGQADVVVVIVIVVVVVVVVVGFA
jgi:hypothetical protein